MTTNLHCCHAYAMTERHSPECLARQARADVDHCKANHPEPVLGCWVCDERKAGR